MKSKTGKALLQLAAVVFMLNATTAVGACCFSLTADEPAQAQSMPCHAQPDTPDADETGDCCLMCVPMLAESSISPIKTIQAPADTLSERPFVVNSTDPPYRPPIQHLA